MAESANIAIATLINLKMCQTCCKPVSLVNRKSKLQRVTFRQIQSNAPRAGENGVNHNQLKNKTMVLTGVFNLYTPEGFIKCCDCLDIGKEGVSKIHDHCHGP